MAILVVTLVSVLTFMAGQLMPGDPALAALGGDDVAVDRAQIEEMRKELGLDQPVLIQYVNYMTGVMHLDFGQSFRTREPVWDLVRERIPVTLQLNAATFVLNVLIGVALGVVAALRPGKLDLLATTWAVLGVATPGFWLAILLIIVFSVWLGWLPTSGWVSPASDPLGSVRYMILPVLALGALGSATVTRQMRSALLETMRQDYIRTARAKGLPPMIILYRHALKPAVLPVMTVLGFMIASLIGGSVLVEQVFAIPGMGRLAVDATRSQDYPILQAIVLLSAVMVVFANLVVDLTYGLLDPRIRY